MSETTTPSPPQTTNTSKSHNNERHINKHGAPYKEGNKKYWKKISFTT